MTDSTLTAAERLDIDARYRALERDYLASNHRRKIDVISRAFRMAARCHAGQRRRNGEPLITHPLEVARIVSSELGLGSNSISGALLHEVLRSGRTTVEEIRLAFGDTIADIVDNLERISGGIFSAEAEEEADRFRSLLLSMNADIRVVIIKMADRIHNMRDLTAIQPEKQQRIAREALYVYAPLAERLGLYSLKREFEERAFACIKPEEQAEIARMTAGSEQERMAIIRAVRAPLEMRLRELGYDFEIKARVKSPYSIWRKMQKKNISFGDVYDVYALRVIFEAPGDDPEAEADDCAVIAEAVTALFEEHPGRRRDWARHPKANGYRATHLTVKAPTGQWVEVQIRSQRMDEIAELGYAAHWKYKTGMIGTDSAEFEQLMTRVKDTLAAPSPTAIDFLATVKLNLFSPDIYVLTPKGDVINLPSGSTVRDMAYAIHSDMGRGCLAGQIGRKLVGPDHPLQSGDCVKIIFRNATVKKRKPKKNEPE
ncbi:MAG: bifunctional (p)ppGpp synthetase/guanosine-3',5'-bis(diphosphate) 3'-pyrophosphohydrolase [Bacteroides sp.]|nr:bifunctional (p)ppGpp synthetase/guanosine-3',5'-bis(diphosphate) 3'-pyrophosphohydrolase [Bacteroides sp.]MBD5336205.1 bifunctional (p)ppGpp synthetase/guanosine-3',5'-bis(diphosphate) 3'-pyrophosphohydrolase [Bacteroides sp.]